MIRTITLKTVTPKGQRVVSSIQGSLKGLVDDEPVELFFNVDEFDRLVKTMEVLFDRASVERIKEAKAAQGK